MDNAEVKSYISKLNDISAKVKGQLVDIKDPFPVDLIQQGVDTSIQLLEEILSKKPTGFYSDLLNCLKKTSIYLKDEFLTEATNGFIQNIEKSRARRHLTMIYLVVDEIVTYPTQDIFDRVYSSQQTDPVKKSKVVRPRSIN